MQFHISSRRESGQRDTCIFKIIVPTNVFSNQFCIYQMHKATSGPLNRRGIVDLVLLRTLFAICQWLLEPRFWKVMESFVLLACASLGTSRISNMIEFNEGIFYCTFLL